MRTRTFSAVGEYGFCGAVYYPDEVCFAYNPNSLAISFTNTEELFNVYLDKVTVYVGTFRIDCNLYGDRAVVRLSNVFRIFFDDIATRRVMRIPVTIVPTCCITDNTFNEEDIVFAETFTVVCGSLAIGQRCNIYGAFDYDASRPYHYRKIRWFKNLPQYISMLRVAYTRTLAYKNGWGTGEYMRVYFRPKVMAVSYSTESPTSSKRPAPPKTIDFDDVADLKPYNGKTAIDKAVDYNMAAGSAESKGAHYKYDDKIGDITGAIVIHRADVDHLDFGEVAGYERRYDTQDKADTPKLWEPGWPGYFPGFPTGNDDEGTTDDDGSDPNPDNDGTPNTPDGGKDDYGDNTGDPDIPSGGDEPVQPSDSGLPESDEDFYVVYFALLHRFYGYNKSTGLFVDEWEEQGNYEASYAYNDNGVAIREIEYEYGGKVAVIGDNWMLRVLGFGNGSPVGMIDVNPRISFNGLMDGVTRVRMLMSWIPLLKINGTRPRNSYRPVFADSVVDIEICPRTCGYYLRWIDHIGYSQFFLFDKGGVEYNIERSEDKRYGYIESNGLDFETRHDLYAELERNATCCAVFLDDALFEEVRTIGSATHIDLYCGKDSVGREIWEPVTIAETNITHKDDHRLHNVEITFTRMEEKSQRL